MGTGYGSRPRQEGCTGVGETLEPAARRHLTLFAPAGTLGHLAQAICDDPAVSYDLDVYVPRALEPSAVRAMVAGSPTLVPADDGEVGSDSLIVLRGARRRYCFTVDGPDALDAEDVPEAVTSVVLGAKYLYSVVVEGSSATDIPHAVRFARRLAKELEGAALDRQVDEVWSRSHSRSVATPAREERVSVVDVDIYCLRDGLTPEPARLFAETAQRLLPEALPRRFGEYEPLQGKLTDAGIEGFCEAWNAATSLVFLSGSGPCIGGSLHAGPNDRFPSPFWRLSLQFHADPLRDERWRDATRRLVTTLADRLPAFYASAQLTRDHIWSGRSLWSDARTEWALSPLRAREGWLGLPPMPTWWAWFGPPYRELVHDLLDSSRTTSTGAGLLHEWSDEPVDRTDLAGVAAQWLPAVLLASYGPNPEGQLPVPLTRAACIPPQLSLGT